MPTGQHGGVGSGHVATDRGWEFGQAENGKESAAAQAGLETEAERQACASPGQCWGGLVRLLLVYLSPTCGTI